MYTLLLFVFFYLFKPCVFVFLSVNAPSNIYLFRFENFMGDWVALCIFLGVRDFFWKPFEGVGDRRSLNIEALFFCGLSYLI
jgi:hypothetical protein